MNPTLDVSLVELICTFLAGGAFYGLYQLARDVARAFARDRSDTPAESAPAQMVVIPAWPEPVDDGPDLKPGPGWRRELQLASAPMCPPLPKYPSLVNFKGWNLDDQQRTQAWPIIKGYDADDLDPGPEPVVDPATQRRFVRSDADMPALAVAQGFEGPRHRFAVTDAALAEVAERLAKKAEVSA